MGTDGFASFVKRYPPPHIANTRAKASAVCGVIKKRSLASLPLPLNKMHRPFISTSPAVSPCTSNCRNPSAAISQNIASSFTRVSAFFFSRMHPNTLDTSAALNPSFTCPFAALNTGTPAVMSIGNTPTRYASRNNAPAAANRAFLVDTATPNTPAKCSRYAPYDAAFMPLAAMYSINPPTLRMYVLRVFCDLPTNPPNMSAYFAQSTSTTRPDASRIADAVDASAKMRGNTSGVLGTSGASILRRCFAGTTTRLPEKSTNILPLRPLIHLPSLRCTAVQVRPTCAPVFAILSPTYLYVFFAIIVKFARLTTGNNTTPGQDIQIHQRPGQIARLCYALGAVLDKRIAHTARTRPKQNIIIRTPRADVFKLPTQRFKMPRVHLCRKIAISIPHVYSN